MRIFTLLLCSPGLLAAEPVIVHTDVFTSGKEGYHAFRIPALVTAADGTLIAFAEGRKENRSDPGGGDIDLVCKRSTDQGATWSALQVVDDPGEKWGASNPVPILDRSNGRLWIAFNRWEPGHGTESSKQGTTNNQTWLRYSDDHGKTWSAARDITRQSRHFDEWGAIFIGPGGGIQTRTGRLIIPAAMKNDSYSIAVATGHFVVQMSTMRAYVLYSDDHGQTWRRSDLLRAFTNEDQVVELADGAIMIDARQGDGEHRWVAVSQDGGQTWSRPRLGQKTPAIATGLERYTLESAGADRDRLVWTGITGPGRRNLVIRVSYDEGQTFAHERVLYGGLAAYSDTAILKDQTVGVLWERGVSDGYQFITFTRVNREFLEPPGAAIPAR